MEQSHLVKTSGMNRSAITHMAKYKSWLRKLWYILRRWPIIPGVILGTLAIAATIGPILAPHDPLLGSLAARHLPPVWAGGTSTHLLGTDLFGRDILSLLLYGARISLLVAGVALAVGIIVGTAMGLIAGYFGGLVDEIVMRMVDIWLALPFLLIAFVVAVTIGGSLTVVIALLALSSWSAGARNVRGEVLSLKSTDYVALAKVAGASHWRIMMRHLLPMTVHVIIVITTLRVGALIIAEAGLSFLGVGVPASTPTWGIVISQGQNYLLTAWWNSIIPGVAILLTVMAFNFLGDWLRDRFDPRLRQLD